MTAPLVDGARLHDPRPVDVATYLASLPAGLDSYPECTAKVALARAFVERLERAFPVSSLDAGLRASVDQPVSAWMSEAASTAVFLAARPMFKSDEEFLRWVADGDRELLSSPLYRALFWLVGPTRVLRTGAERWARFHRGTTLRIEDAQAGEVRARLTFPRGLFPPLAIEAYARSFQIALELAGASPCTCTVESHTPLDATFVARWSAR